MTRFWVESAAFKSSSIIPVRLAGGLELIATEKFTYIHQPKTGGTFVSTVLFRVHQVPWNIMIHLASALKPNLSFRTKYGTFIFNNNKHGTCSEIPHKLMRNVTLASVRNPYDLLVSQYEFGWWKRRQFMPYYRAVPEFKSRFPRFPDLNFAEFVELTDEAFLTVGSNKPGSTVGLMTRDFMHYYFKDMKQSLDRFDEEYLTSRAFEADLRPVRFLLQHRLNEDLYHFLLENGYDLADISFIRDMRKVLPGGKGRTSLQKWEHYFTPELKQRVRYKERLLFELFPEFDV